MEKPPTCLRCSSDAVLPIAYGLPSPEMVEESVAGRVVLGGCLIFPAETADWHCVGCAHEWRGNGTIFPL